MANRHQQRSINQLRKTYAVDVTSNAAYTAQQYDHIVNLVSTSGAKAITLPDLDYVTEITFVAKTVTGGTYTIAVVGGTITLAAAGDAATVICDGAGAANVWYAKSIRGATFA